ncbi:hypothetical protein PoB_000302500 [Plakobranchus ocellatus]|uniref:Uncharacterized protein n=1 Tax=Plakobranchus ocellatus TaxID=259542 RepID=A0AAV3Y0B4_9GAST|nr:hypothetical protein PoB_000302500 [Plakobranchus ocellatus]
MQKKSTVNPNVSMAIARKCASILETSKQMTEDDISDAETLSSEHSEDSEDGDEEDNDDDVDGDMVEEKDEDISDGEESDDEWSENQQISERIDKEVTSDEESDDQNNENVSVVSFSEKDLQDDFVRLTKNTRYQKSPQFQPVSDNLVKRKSTFHKHQEKPILTKKPAKTAHPSDQGHLRVDKSKAQNGAVLNDTDTSITDSMINLSFVENMILKTNRRISKSSANISAATFNVSHSKKLTPQASNVLSALDGSFSAPVDNLSFVAISSPVKKTYIKNKKDVESDEAKPAGDTYVIDRYLKDKGPIPPNVKADDPMVKNGLQLDGKKRNGFTLLEPEKNVSTLEKTKTSTTLLKSQKPLSSATSLSSCAVPGNSPSTNGVFKSPHGIKIRRVRPKQVSSAMSVSSQDSNPSEQIGTSNFPTVVSWSPKGKKSWVDSDSVVTSASVVLTDDQPGSVSHIDSFSAFTHNKENKACQESASKFNPSKEIKTIVKDVSFSSYDSYEKPQFNFAFRSPTKRKSCPSSVLHCKGSVMDAKPLMSSSFKKSSPSKSDRHNVSITSSLKNLDLKSDQVPTRKGTFDLPTSYRHPGSKIPLSTVESCCALDKDNTTFTQHTSSLSHFCPENKRLQFPERWAPGARIPSSIFKRNSFDPGKWRCQEKSESACESIKRKIPESFTSGYFTETSPTLSEMSPFATNNINSTFSLLKRTGIGLKEKVCEQQPLSEGRQLNECLCFRCPHSPQHSRCSTLQSTPYIFGSKSNNKSALSFKDLQQDGLSKPHSSVDKPYYVGTSLTDAASSMKKRSYGALPKLRPKTVFPRGIQNNGHSKNPFLLKNKQRGTAFSPLPRITSPQLCFNTDNSHVLRWVEATSKHCHPQTPNSSSHFAEPPASPQKNLCFPNQGLHERLLKPSTRTQSEHQNLSSLMPEKKDVGVQATLHFDLWQGFAESSLPSKYAGSPCWNSQKNQLNMKPTCFYTPPEFCNTSQKFASLPLPASSHPQSNCFRTGNLNTMQSHQIETTVNGDMQDKSFSIGQGSLNRRAMAVWREIQAERSVADESTGDFSIINTETSQSPSADDCQSISDDGEEEVVNETLIESEGKGQSKLFGNIDKMLASNLESASFVESLRAKSKANVKVDKPSNSFTGAGSTRQQTSTNIMFPMSYINKFSPDNPARMDSDMTAYQYEQQVLASQQPFKSMLKSFKPRRHQQQQLQRHSPIGKQYKTVESHSFLEPFRDPCSERPSKFRKVSKLSLPRKEVISPTKCTSPATNKTIKLENDRISEPISSSRVKTAKSSPLSRQKLHSEARHRISPSHRGAKRASTPIKKNVDIPELGLDETISTIISTAAVAEAENDNYLASIKTITQQDSVVSLLSSDSSDSENEVSLL